MESVYEGLKYKLRLEFPAGMTSFELIYFTHCLLTCPIALPQAECHTPFVNPKATKNQYLSGAGWDLSSFSMLLFLFAAVAMDYLSSVTAAEDQLVADA